MGGHRQEIAHLISESHSAALAAAYTRFDPTPQHLSELGAVGREVLEHFPYAPGACAIMSAIYAARFQMRSDAPIYVAAGELRFNNRSIFGGGDRLGRSTFDVSDLDWDGHCWIVFGDYVADVSLFRTAYATPSSRFAKDILERFGAGRGLLIGRQQVMKEGDGLEYRSQLILTEDQISALCRGASSFVARRR